MSGTKSSVLAGSTAADAVSLLSFSVHSLPSPQAAAAARRTARGRLQMALVLLVCAAPVVASYLAYFGLRPSARTNYSELIVPARPMPADLPLARLDGRPVNARSLKGQWLLVVVSGAACDTRCERYLWLQRQLRETLGVEADRVDKLWLIDDVGSPRRETLAAVAVGTPATVLRVPHAALAAWLQPAVGHALNEQMVVVDPMGDWMMRIPVDPDPARLKHDIEKLLRASAGWDRAGRG